MYADGMKKEAGGICVTGPLFRWGWFSSSCTLFVGYRGHMSKARQKKGT